MSDQTDSLPVASALSKPTDCIFNSQPPLVMAIINITPDSFYSASRAGEPETIALRAREAVLNGASIIDLGAYSSRPGAQDVSAEDELKRLSVAMKAIRGVLPEVAISLDTFRAEVARSIVTDFGDCIINDISAGELDSQMLEFVAQHNLPYIAMHMRGTPRNMQSKTSYGNITEEVMGYFGRRLEEFERRGVHKVIIDPGFGFAKTTEQNYELLRNLHRLSEFGRPILAGISRKSMIYKVLGTDPAGALNGTTALNWECLRQGASVLRVHDTAQAVETVKLWSAFK